MATSKRKSAPAPKKKVAANKAGSAKKPAPKKSTAPKKAVPKKLVKSAAKPAAKKKPVPAAKPMRSAAVVKPQRPAQKVAPASKSTQHAKPAKPAPPKAATKPAPILARQAVLKKPAASAVKPASPKQALPTKSKMASAATATSDTVTREDGRYALPSTVVIDLPPNYRPNGKEEYMGPRQLAYFRAKLQKWREELVEESKQTIDNLRDEVRDVGDEAERATRETENSLELRTRDRYRKLIGKIDKALKRIEEGRYGFCEETDEEIGIERLEARPIATLSLDAQERWEHRQKQMGD
jgi:DnaK suppressor protein